MNYQPSFAQGGTKVASDPSLDQLRWVALKSRATVPDSQARREGALMPLLWRGAHTGDLQRHGISEPTRMNGDESRAPTPGPQDRDRAGDEQGEPKPDQPRRRVPDRDIIYVGPHRNSASEPVDVRDLAFLPQRPVPQAALQNSPAGRRSLVPVLLALLVFEIVVSGGIYASKRYAEAQVIVVPATTSEDSLIT